MSYVTLVDMKWRRPEKVVGVAAFLGVSCAVHAAAADLPSASRAAAEADADDGLWRR